MVLLYARKHSAQAAQKDALVIIVGFPRLFIRNTLRRLKQVIAWKCFDRTLDSTIHFILKVFSWRDRFVAISEITDLYRPSATTCLFRNAFVSLRSFCLLKPNFQVIFLCLFSVNLQLKCSQ